jgi:hypothetical protein
MERKQVLRCAQDDKMFRVVLVLRFPRWGWNCDNSALFFLSGALI